VQTIDPKNTAIPQLFGYLTGTVGPRPIAFASTINKDGAVNLAPFSFFNVFSANPPILVFSPSRSGRDNSTKNTLDNVLEVPETVVNIVNYDIVQQMSLASTAYAKDVNEFTKSGLTELASETIRPPRVAESPIQLECKVTEVKPLGDQGGAGNLVICEILKIHIKEEVLDDQGAIDPIQLDQVIRTNIIFNGNDLGKLGNVERLPTATEIEDFKQIHPELSIAVKQEDTQVILQKAKELLTENLVMDAWKTLLTTLK